MNIPIALRIFTSKFDIFVKKLTYGRKVGAALKTRNLLLNLERNKNGVGFSLKNFFPITVIHKIIYEISD